MARLKWVGKRQRKQGGSRATSNIALSVVCAYARTARATPGVKIQFALYLQNTLDKIPQSDTLVFLGEIKG